ncbi:hypothetical protein [Thalassomonas sp. M1454]|uniref:hypothetical protein n=1 Tax=Thalassomonas sp. M1454 TaxID=2594477 RepID=UPI00163DDDA5|nr:hypothetical protein [Thalassomonas sp. M1454]
MTLFSWFNRVDEINDDKLITIKPVALKQTSMWPVAKIKFTNSLVDHSKPTNEEGIEKQ